jgi:molecular chaperone Hsp33
VGDRGHLIVTRDPGIGEPFRGVVPLFSGEIAKDFAFYLSESEQTPAAVALGVYVVPAGRVSHAGGLLVQLLPGVSDDEADDLGRRVTRMGSITTALHRGDGPEQWLHRLFPEGFDVLDRTTARFRCGCSAERVEAALKLLGAGEIEDMLRRSHTKPEAVVCEFCRTSYSLSRQQLERLLAEVHAETRAQ